MVIIRDKSGQLANRLFSFAHFLGNSIEHNYKLINPSFDEYKYIYPATLSNNFEGCNVSTNIFNMPFGFFLKITKLIKKCARSSRWHEFQDLKDDGEFFDLTQTEYLHLASNKILFMSGWQYRDFANLRKHRALIKNFFTPHNFIMDEVAQHCKLAKGMADVLIGVHIRRGDYINWKDGIYFYDDFV